MHRKFYATFHAGLSCDLSLQGGTAVGTGLNTKAGFDVKFAQTVADDTGAAGCMHHSQEAKPLQVSKSNQTLVGFSFANPSTRQALRDSAQQV